VPQLTLLLGERCSIVVEDAALLGEVATLGSDVPPGRLLGATVDTSTARRRDRRGRPSSPCGHAGRDARADASPPRMRRGRAFERPGSGGRRSSWAIRRSMAAPMFRQLHRELVAVV